MPYIICVFYGVLMGALLFSNDTAERHYIRDAESAKKECEFLIPRSQMCEVVITAVPVENKGEIK